MREALRKAALAVLKDHLAPKVAEDVAEKLVRAVKEDLDSVTQTVAGVLKEIQALSAELNGEGKRRKKKATTKKRKVKKGEKPSKSKVVEAPPEEDDDEDEDEDIKDADLDIDDDDEDEDEDDD